MSYSSPPPEYGAPSPYGNPAASGTNTKAIWSLVTGILGLVLCGIFAGIPALVLGNMASKEIAGTGQGGGGMATAGKVLGIISIVLTVLGIILVVSGVFSASTTNN